MFSFNDEQNFLKSSQFIKRSSSGVIFVFPFRNNWKLYGDYAIKFHVILDANLVNEGKFLFKPKVRLLWRHVLKDYLQAHIKSQLSIFHQETSIII